MLNEKYLNKVIDFAWADEISFDSKHTVNILPNSTDSILPTNQVFDENWCYRTEISRRIFLAWSRSLKISIFNEK